MAGPGTPLVSHVLDSEYLYLTLRIPWSVLNRAPPAVTFSKVSAFATFANAWSSAGPLFRRSDLWSHLYLKRAGPCGQKHIGSVRSLFSTIQASKLSLLLPATDFQRYPNPSFCLLSLAELHLLPCFLWKRIKIDLFCCIGTRWFCFSALFLNKNWSFLLY